MKKLQVVLLITLASYAFLQAREMPPDKLLKAAYLNGHWGYANAEGKFVIEARYDAALPFANGLARVAVVDEQLPEIDGRPNLLWGYIDESGHVVVQLRYQELHGFSEGLAAVAALDPDQAHASVFVRRLWGNLRWGYVDREGRVVLPLQFFAAADFSEGVAAVDVGGESDGLCGRNRRYGYTDKTGTMVVKPRFAGAGPFRNGRARVSLGHTTYEGRCVCCNPRFIGQTGSIDRSGEFVTDEKPNGEGSGEPAGLEVRQ